MLIEIILLLFATSFSVLITLFLIPLGCGYHYFAPILLWFAGYLLGMAIMWCLLFIFTFPVNKKKKYEKPMKWASFWLTHAISYIDKHSRAKMKVIYNKPLPNERFLLVCNHRSKFDPMLLTMLYGKLDLAFITKPSNFKIPIGGRFMPAVCYMAIDREDKLQSLEVMKRATKLITDNATNVGVFPEGTRNSKNDLLPFHEGVFSIAKNSKCPIVVTSFMGTEKIHKNFPLKRTQITLQIIDVLYPHDYEGKTLKEISDHCCKLMDESLSDK